MSRSFSYSTDNSRRVEGMTRDEVCNRYYRKVVLLARRVHERLAPDATIQIDDLVSSGALGLLEAFDRFEPARGIQFSTYAEYRIRGAMYDDLRKGDTFTRRRRQLAKRIERATEELRRAFDRDPEPQEVADYLGIDLDQYWRDVDRVKPISHVSLDGSPGGDEDEGRPLVERLMAANPTSPDSRLRTEDVRRQLKETIASLPDRQRQCVLMYYGKEMSLQEISEVYGVTVSRISQILSDSRRKLRKKLDASVEPGDLSPEQV